MKELKIIIIGNRLIEFANNKNIFSFDQFSYLLSTESKLLNSQNNYLVNIGQGLNDKVTPSSRPPEGKFLGEILAVSF